MAKVYNSYAHVLITDVISMYFVNNAASLSAEILAQTSITKGVLINTK